MSDERIVEVIAESLFGDPGGSNMLGPERSMRCTLDALAEGEQ